uniref:Uncharacterized protein n=1 Tax=Anguilla anguilla TaxID=7936 RepID=A0A0E9RXH9_ANGAN
MTFRLTFANS